MTRVIKQAVVEYSAEQMFALVNDIESYPDFLPWCTATHVIKRDNESLTASVSVAAGKIKQNFTTANTMYPHELIKMQLVQGPFKQLTGHWRFDQNQTDRCTVSFDMQFEFKNKLIKHVLGAAFQKIIDSMVDAFVARAREVYA